MDFTLNCLLTLLYLTHPIQANPLESELINTLLKNYNKLSRPSNSTNVSSSLTVRIGLALLQIINVDEKAQIISLNVWQRSSWSDSALIWNASDYGNTSYVRIPIKYLWKPDILVYNIADEGIFEYMTHLGNMNTVISNNGLVIFVPPMILKTTCKMDLVSV